MDTNNTPTSGNSMHDTSTGQFSAPKTPSISSPKSTTPKVPNVPKTPSVSSPKPTTGGLNTPKTPKAPSLHNPQTGKFRNFIEKIKKWGFSDNKPNRKSFSQAENEHYDSINVNSPNYKAKNPIDAMKLKGMNDQQKLDEAVSRQQKWIKDNNSLADSDPASLGGEGMFATLRDMGLDEAEANRLVDLHGKNNESEVQKRIKDMGFSDNSDPKYPEYHDFSKKHSDNEAEDYNYKVGKIRSLMEETGLTVADSPDSSDEIMFKDKKGNVYRAKNQNDAYNTMLNIYKEQNNIPFGDSQMRNLVREGKGQQVVDAAEKFLFENRAKPKEQQELMPGGGQYGNVLEVLQNKYGIYGNDLQNIRELALKSILKSWMK